MSANAYLQICAINIHAFCVSVTSASTFLTFCAIADVLLDPENEADMAKIFRILEESDIDCDSDDDIEREPQRLDTTQIEHSESESDSEVNTSSGKILSAAGDVRPSLAEAVSANQPSSAHRPSHHVIWKKAAFNEKQIPAHLGETDENDVPRVPSPLEYFKNYFPNEFFESAAAKTAMYTLAKTGRCIAVTSAKVKQVFGMHVIMGCIRYPQLHMYWKHSCKLDIVSSVMSRDEFKRLRRDLHFVDTVHQPPDAAENKLWKVQPVIITVRDQCLRIK